MTMADVQRVHIDVPESAGLAGHPDYFAVQDGDNVVVLEGPDDAGWMWKLLRPDGRTKLEAGNFPDGDAASAAAREAFGDDIALMVQESD